MLRVIHQPSQWAPPSTSSSDTCYRICCLVATYNTLSSATNLQRQCLQSFLEAQQLAVFGLQECRQVVAPCVRVGGTLRFASQPEDGNLGCQIWFNVAGPYRWVAQSFRIIFSDPRLLVVCAKLESCQLAFFSGHCPTATSPASERAQWWSMLRQRLAALPAHTVPILMLDANSRFALQQGAEAPANCNACEFDRVLRDFGLARTKSCDAQGQQRPSWRPPGCNTVPVCLDYVAWPTSWDVGFRDEGIRDIVDEHVGIDHQPVLATADLCLQHTVPPTYRVDREAMCTPEGRMKLRAIFEAAPQPAWQVSVNDHLHILNRYFQQCLAEVFPWQSCKPRKPTLSMRTWALLQDKRRQRRCFRRQRLLHSRWVAAQCFAAWRGVHREPAAGRVRAHDQCAAQHIATMRRLSREARDAQREDDAAFVKQQYAEARDKGPEALAKRIRAVLRCGRNARIPALAVEIDTERGHITDPTEVKAAFAEHFAQAEAATAMPLEELATRPAQPTRGPCHLDDLPTMAQISASFASLKRNKASGIACLPAELYSQAPLGAALAHMPLVLKIVSRHQFPTLWSGLLACALPKPGKPANRLTGYRSVALVEPAAKGVLKATRPALSQGFEAIALPTVGGARRKYPTELAALSTQSHLARLRRLGQSGSVLYLDGTSAFYAVDRSHLFSGDLGKLREHLQQLPLEGAVRDRLLAAVSDKGALGRAGVPQGIQDLLQAAFQATWFVVDAQQPEVQATTRGTTPGSPLADLLYQFVSEAAMRCLADHLRSEGIDAAIPESREHPHSLPQSWLDDVALLLGARSAGEVGANTARAAALAHQYLAATGVEVNYAPGKTEALMYHGGKGADQARRAVFVDGAATVNVALPAGRQVLLRCVSEYVHLGTTRRYNANCEAAIVRRDGLAREKFQAFKRHVLANGHLTCRERQELFKAVILARFLHGLGTLEFPCDKVRTLFTRKYMGLVRGAIRPLHGVPCRRLTDEQACALMGVVTPQEATHVAVARTLTYVASKGDPYLRHCLQGSTWGRAVPPAFRHIAAVVGNDNLVDLACPGNESSFAHCTMTPAYIRPVLRKYSRLCTAGRNVLVAPALSRARAHAQAARDGLFFFRVDVGGGPEARFPCSECAMSFRTAAALGSHLAKAHGQAAISSSGFGTACEVCRRQFWSTKRLRQHLRRSQPCAKTYVEADGATNQPAEQLADSNTPPTALIGPVPWWATQTFSEGRTNAVTPLVPDPLRGLSRVQTVEQLPSFLRMWVQAVESDWEPPECIDVTNFGPVASLALAVAGILPFRDRHQLVHSGTLGALICQDAVLAGPRELLRKAQDTYWADMC